MCSPEKWQPISMNALLPNVEKCGISSGEVILVLKVNKVAWDSFTCPNVWQGDKLMSAWGGTILTPCIDTPYH